MNAEKNDAKPCFPFVFVVGCPRSGTYLLVSSLNSTGLVAIPVETHFIPLFARMKWLWGDLNAVNNRKLLCDCIFDFLEIWDAYSKGSRDGEKIKDFSLLSISEELPEIVSSGNSFSELVGVLFARYAKSQGAVMAGDKSAFFSHMPIERMATVLPESRAVHIVRDGRDVALSWRNIWTGPKTLAVAAYEWKRHVREKQKWGSDHKDLYFELKYEEFLESSPQLMEAIMDFLCLSDGNHEPSRMDGGFSKVLSEGDTHSLLGKPIDSSNKEKWRTKMTKRDCDLFEYIAGKELKAFGYEVKRDDFSVWEHLYFCTVFAVSWLGDKISFRNAKILVKSLLPVAILVARKIGRPLPGLLRK